LYANFVNLSSKPEKDKDEEVTTILRTAIGANPKRYTFAKNVRSPFTDLVISLLLHYAYINVLESKKSLSECNNLFESLENQRAEEVERLTQAMNDELVLLDNTINDIDELNKQKESVKREREQVINGVKREATNVWIMHMRFAIRAEVSGGMDPKEHPRMSWNE
jgi:hypothetical protein